MVRITFGAKFGRGPGPWARKRPRRKGSEPEREPVEPKNPKLLSGGAAAELEYDD